MLVDGAGCDVDEGVDVEGDEGPAWVSDMAISCCLVTHFGQFPASGRATAGTSPATGETRTPRTPFTRTMHARTTVAGASLLGADRRDAVVSLARSTLVCLAVVAAYFGLPMHHLDPGSGLRLTAGLALVAAVLAWHLREITRSSHPRLRAVEALAVTLTVLFAVFATAYFVLDRSTPASFNEPMTRLDAAYFTVTVFATVGFGDIVAVSQAARVVATLQMVADLVLVGVVAKMVVGAVQVGLERRQDGS